jgi:RecA/RadA recombinase
MPIRTVDPSLRDKLRAQIARDYGQHTLLAGNEVPKARRMPTRSLALDYATGGGYPFGAFTRFWGAFSTGKTKAILNAFWVAQNYDVIRCERLTYLADVAKVAGEAKEAKALREQAKHERELYAGGLKCLFVNSETKPEDAYLQHLGLRTDKDSLEYVESNRIEVIGDIVQQALGAYHVIAVDSTTKGVSLAELNDKDGIYNDRPGMLRVQKWGRNLDWWSDRMNSDNIVIFSSQIQSKVGMNAAQRIEGEHPPGGMKMQHDPGVVLHFMKGGWLKRKDNGGLEPQGQDGGAKGAFGRAQPAGMEVVVRCDKNKFGRSHRVVLLHDDKRAAQWDALFEYEKFAKYFKVVAGGSGGWWSLPDGTKSQSLRSAISEDENLRRQVEAVVLRCAEDPRFEDDLLASRNGHGEALVELSD